MQEKLVLLIIVLLTTNSGTQKNQLLVKKIADAGAEVVVGLTYKPVTFTAYIDAKDSNDYNYYTFSGSVGSVDLLYGISDSKTSGADYTHFDATYNASDKLSFTVSLPSGDGLTTANKDPLFKMSYALPI